jgi:flavodoxin
MKKILKIILAVITALIIIVVAFGAIIFTDVAAYTATNSQTLPATGTAMGTALVLYDPGLSGTATHVAEKIAADLQAEGLTVTLAGIKSSAAADPSGYDVVVVGGPVYAGAVTASVKDALATLAQTHSSDTVVGVYGSGQGSSTPEDITQIKDSVPALQSSGALSNAVVVKIGESEDLAARAADFVSQLVS